MNRQEVMTEIENTFSNLKTALSGFTEMDLNTLPFEGSWTAGQVAEHIIKSIGGIPDSRTEPANRAYDEKIGSIRELFLNMEMKFQTAPVLEPEQSHHQPRELLNILNGLEKQHMKTAREADLEALCLDMELPTFGHLTRYEWLRFMMVHTQRHTKQIEHIHEILSHENPSKYLKN